MRATSETKSFIFQKPQSFTLQNSLKKKKIQQEKRMGMQEKTSECLVVSP